MKTEDRSVVTVYFHDGEEKTYDISASPYIAKYLALEAADTGILTILNGREANSIPLASIREWNITAVEED